MSIPANCVQITDGMRQKIKAEQERAGISAAALAKAVGYKSRTDIWKIHSGGKTYMERAKMRAIANTLEIDPAELDVQYELRLQIDDEFISSAQEALRAELEHLRDQVGSVPAADVTGSVGVHFHGPPPERRSIEREFQVRAKPRSIV